MANNADTIYHIKGQKTTLDIIQNACGANDKGETELAICEVLDRMNIPSECIYCKGSFYLVDRIDNNTLDLVMDTAWDWLPDVVKVLKFEFNYDNDFKIDFVCTEPGNNIFVTTSKDIFKVEYWLDDTAGETDGFYEKDNSDLAFEKMMAKARELCNGYGIPIPSEISTFDELEKWIDKTWEEKDLCDFINVARYKVIS